MLGDVDDRRVPKDTSRASQYPRDAMRSNARRHGDPECRRLFCSWGTLLYNPWWIESYTTASQTPVQVTDGDQFWVRQLVALSALRKCSTSKRETLYTAYEGDRNHYHHARLYGIALCKITTKRRFDVPRVLARPHGATSIL